LIKGITTVFTVFLIKWKILQTPKRISKIYTKTNLILALILFAIGLKENKWLQKE